MEAQFWLDKWAQNQIGFHEQEPHPCMQEYWPRVSGSSREPVFVPLCGKSNDMPWLAARGHSIVGVELSDIAVHDFFTENEISYERCKIGALDCFSAADYRVFCADIFEYASDNQTRFKLLYDRAALIALNEDQRGAYAQLLTQIASPNASMLLITVDYDPELISPPPHIVTHAEVENLFSDYWQIELLQTTAADIKGQPGTESSYHLRRTHHAR